MPVMALIKSKRENMNIINSIIEVGPECEPYQLVIDHDEETGSSRGKLRWMGYDIIDVTWDAKRHGEAWHRLGATSHGLTQMYLHIHHSLLDTAGHRARDYFTWKREEILSSVRKLGVIYNGDEWWDKLKQSHYRLPITRVISETSKVVMILTSDNKCHKAVYLISTDIKSADKCIGGDPIVVGSNVRIINHHDLASSPVPIDTIVLKYAPELINPERTVV